LKLLSVFLISEKMVFKFNLCRYAGLVIDAVLWRVSALGTTQWRGRHFPR
jgi:hypothetical protein